MYHTGLLQEDLPETIHHFILHFVFVLVKSMLLFSPLTLGSGICIHLDYKIVVVKHEHIFEGAATTASNIVLDRDVFLSLRPIPENQNNGSTFNLLLAFSFLNFDPIRLSDLQPPSHQLEVSIRLYVATVDMAVIERVVEARVAASSDNTLITC